MAYTLYNTQYTYTHNIKLRSKYPIYQLECVCFGWKLFIHLYWTIFNLDCFMGLATDKIFMFLWIVHLDHLKTHKNWNHDSNHPQKINIFFSQLETGFCALCLPLSICFARLHSQFALSLSSFWQVTSNLLTR